MTYHITHRTLYEYAAPVTVSHHVARLEPCTSNRQACERFTLKIFPDPALRKDTRIILATGFVFLPFKRSIADWRSSRTAASPCRRQKSGAENSLTWETAASLFRDPVSPEVVEPYQFIFDSPHIRASLELADYARESFAQKHTADRRRARFDPPHF